MNRNRYSGTLLGVVIALIAVPLAGGIRPVSGQAVATAERAVAFVPDSVVSGGGTLYPGDAVRLVFWREPDLNGDFPIDENGQTVLPILGLVGATGSPPRELRARLASAYGEQLRNQEVQITLLRRVRVLGAVSEPGLYFVDPTMSLGDAIALAGGPSDRGKLDGIRVLSGDRVIRDRLGPDDLFDAELLSGDRIHIPERSWMSRHSTVLLGGMISATAIVLSRILIG